MKDKGPQPSARAKDKGRSKAPVLNQVTLSSPDRLLYPRDKITKEDVATYYAAVASAMITTPMSPTVLGRRRTSAAIRIMHHPITQMTPASM